jgi:hypothetical protein
MSLARRRQQEQQESDDAALTVRTQAILTRGTPRPCIVQRETGPALEGLGQAAPHGLLFYPYEPGAGWVLIPADELRPGSVRWAPGTCPDCGEALPTGAQVYALTSPDLGRCEGCLLTFLEGRYGAELAAEWEA